MHKLFFKGVLLFSILIFSFTSTASFGTINYDLQEYKNADSVQLKVGISQGVFPPSAIDQEAVEKDLKNIAEKELKEFKNLPVFIRSGRANDDLMGFKNPIIINTDILLKNVSANNSSGQYLAIFKADLEISGNGKTEHLSLEPFLYSSDVKDLRNKTKNLFGQSLQGLVKMLRKARH